MCICLFNTGTASAISETGLKSIRNGTAFYGDDEEAANNNATAGVCGGGSGGSSNEEKIWSFFADKGMTPIAIAGIMGNFKEENPAYDPAVKQNQATHAIPSNGDGATGFGIAQWTSQGRQAGLFKKIDDAGLSKYYGAGFGNADTNKQTIPAEDSDKLLQIELDYTWSGDTPVSAMAEEMNAIKSVSGSGGTTLYFHKAFERSADDASQIQERVTSAEDILSRLGGGTSCGTLGGVATLEDAMAWAEKFVSDVKTKFHPNITNTGKAKISDGFNLYQIADGTMCTFDTSMGCEQCTAASGWFVATMTDYTYRGGNGGEVVANLSGQVKTGKEPKPFSIFSYPTSSYGHTGIVLGVLDNGQVITLENNWPSNGRVVVRQYDISGKGATFAYVGDKMKGNLSGE